MHIQSTGAVTHFRLRGFHKPKEQGSRRRAIGDLENKNTNTDGKQGGVNVVNGELGATGQSGLEANNF